MVQRIPLVGLTLCAFAPSACDRGARTKAPETTPAPPPTIAEPDTRSDCRVIVNGPEQVLDVTIHAEGSPAEVETRANAMVMIVEGRAIALTTHHRGLSSTQTRVALQELPEGLDETLATYYGSLGDIDELIDDCVGALGGAEPMVCDEGFYAHDFASVHSTLGPYLSFSTQSYGYTGGAHPFDEIDLAMWNIGGPKPEEVEVLELIDESGRELLEQELGDYGLPEYYEVELDDHYGGLVSVASTGAVEVEIGFGCCSWAFNHGHFELSATLGAPPGALAAYLPEPGTGRWTRAGCGSVDAEGVVRDIHDAILAELSATPIGVYWIDPSFDLSLSDLPRSENLDHATPLEAKTESPGPLGRRLMKAKRYDEAAAAFELAYRQDSKARWLGELCWAEFKLQNLEQAEAVCAEALRGAPDAHALAAVIYNLGRIAEASGDIEAAISRYETSLGLRPNATVEARVNQLK